MAVTRWENSFAAAGGNSVTYDAAWPAAITDTYASGGDYRGLNVTANKPITIHVATASGFTGALLGATSRSDSSRAVSYTVDGGSAQTWDQNPSGATVFDVNYVQYRGCSLPINFAANGVHDIVIQSSGSGFTTFDFVDLFTAVTPNAANRYTVFAHSVGYGVTSGADATRVPCRWSLQVANYLGLTEDNQGNPAADLTNGSYRAGSPYVTTRLYNQNAHWVPDWMRAEAGANWPANAGALNPLDKGSAWLADPPYGATWGARAPKRAAIMHGVNDLGYETIYETASFAIPVANRNLAGTTTVASPQPAGTVLKWFIQRLREVIARMLLEVPTIDCIDVFGLNNWNFGAASGNYVQIRRWNTAIQNMCAESWIPAGKVLFIDLLDATTCGGGVANGSDLHPSEYGHYVIFDAWRRAYESQKRATASGLVH